LIIFYHAMLRRALLCHSKSSVHPSVCLYLMFSCVFHTGFCSGYPNMGNLVQLEGGMGVGIGTKSTDLGWHWTAKTSLS